MISAMDVLRMVLGALMAVTLVAIGAAIFDAKAARNIEAEAREAIRRSISAEALARRIDRALARGQRDDAAMYAEIAALAGFAIPASTQTRLAQALAQQATAMAGVGPAQSSNAASALSGAVAAELSIVGDIRDIAAEGEKLVAGMPYDELLLGLSVIGVALATVSPSGSAAMIRAKGGASVLKVAAREGQLTAELTRQLRRLLSEAVDWPALARMLQRTPLSDQAATRKAVEAYSAQVRLAMLFPMLKKIERMRERAGTSEAVRLMRFVRTSEDLDAIAAMSEALGRKTRGVVEITGKTRPRLLEGRFNLFTLIAENVPALLAWLGSLLVLFLSRPRLRASEA
jgi:hypothetical protein